MLMVAISFALLGSSRGEYFVPQEVFGHYVGGGYQGPDEAVKRESLLTDASPDVTSTSITNELFPTDAKLDVTVTFEVRPSGGKFERTVFAEPTESDYTTLPSDRTETIKDHYPQTFCSHEFAEEQIPGNPQSTCAGWLLENYHRFKEGWKSCQDVDTIDALHLQTCNQFTRECQKTDSNEACCKNVVCYLQMAGHFYAYNWGQEYSENQKNEYFISTTACMDRDHHRLDRSCVKWMYQFYHVTKQSEGWRKCSDFDYSRHSRVSCNKLKKKCHKADAKGQKAQANEYCCASVHCYGRRRHFLRLSS